MASPFADLEAELVKLRDTPLHVVEGGLAQGPRPSEDFCAGRDYGIWQVLQLVREHGKEKTR